MLNPNNIRFTRRYLDVRELLKLVPASLDVPVTVDDVTALVELLLVNGPVPEVVVHQGAQGPVVGVGNGCRFVSALRAFNDGTALGKTTWIPWWEGKCLNDVDPFLSRRFLQRTVDVTWIDAGTPAPHAAAVIAALARA